MTFSEKITALMREHGVTAKELSEKLCIGKNQFKYWADKGNTPNAETVSKLADYFDVSVDYLLGKTDDRGQEEKKPSFISDETWAKMKNDPFALKLLEVILNMSREQRSKLEELLGEM